MVRDKKIDSDPGCCPPLERRDFLYVVQCAPLVSIDLVVRNGSGQVLVGLRKNEPCQGLWFVPGGCIRKNETIRAAFSRIAQDELGKGITQEQARFLGVYEHFYPQNFAQEPGFGTHYVVLAHEVLLKGDPEINPDPQHDQYRWLSPDALLADPGVHENTKAYFRPAFTRTIISKASLLE